MPRFFVKVIDFIPATKTSRIILPEGAKDERPDQQNIVVLRRTKDGGEIRLPVGDKVFAKGWKLQLKTHGDRVVLTNR